jgi:AmmeMemoRadiSam system protein A
MPATDRLGASERAELLERARRAAAEALSLASAVAPAEPSGLLAEPGAAFVTWRRDGKLRGCIGSVEPVRPLAVDVERNAVAALLHDPRFAPTTGRDFPRLTLEISVLSPRERIASPDELEIGVHGVYVEKGARRGLLLPQVAPEWGWAAEELLEQVCLKAGLPGEAWRRPDVALSRFAAEVFGDPERAAV